MAISVEFRFIIIIIKMCSNYKPFYAFDRILEMYIFHFEAISLSTHISGSKQPIFTNLDSLERPWHVDGFLRNISPK
jgi:hypothetical protein